MGGEKKREEDRNESRGKGIETPSEGQRALKQTKAKVLQREATTPESLFPSAGTSDGRVKPNAELAARLHDSPFQFPVTV